MNSNNENDEFDPFDDEFDPFARADELSSQLNDIEESQPATMRHEDFVYVASEDLFRHVDTLTQYKAAGVDARVQPWRVEDQPLPNGGTRPVRIRPSLDIKNDAAKVVDGVTWYPKNEKIIEGLAITQTGDIRDIPNHRLLNLYVPPLPTQGNVADCGPWLDLGRRLIPDDAVRHRVHQILAYKMRYPENKVNCALLIAGNRRVGKDMWVDAYMKTLGRGNTQTIDPDEIFEPFNPYIQCVALKINEMEPNGQEHRAWALIKKLKPLCAAPPNALFVKDKNVKRYGIPNVCLVVAMTNGLKTIYMEEDRGRWFVIDCYHLPMLWYEKSDPDYFINYKRWLDNGGEAHVAAYLETIDLSDFNPGNPVIVTEALEQLIELSNGAPDDTFERVLDTANNPDCILGAEFYDYIDPADDRARIELDTLFRGRGVMFRAEKSGYRVAYKDRTQQEKEHKERPRWAFKSQSGKVLKSTFALVKAHIPEDEQMELIAKRGRDWLARRENRVTGSVPGVGTGSTVVPLRPDKF